MKQIGPGILSPSEIYFSSPSPKAKKLYYNVLCAGHFFCDNNYRLVRNNYDSILILYITDGNFTFLKDKKEYITAKKGDTVIIDCYKPHEYYTEENLEFLWIHINGANSKDFADEIIKSNGNIITSLRTPALVKEIFTSIKNRRNTTETKLSVILYKLLTELANPLTAKENTGNIHQESIQQIKEYISLNLSEKITVQSLAEKINMSSTHFSRVFRQHTGFSPYDYVLAARLNKAKELLLKTDMTVAEIAYETGFNSEANFVYFFTGSESVSPGKFRKMKF